MSESQIDALRAEFERDLATATTAAGLRSVRDRYLARKGGLVSGLLKALGSAPPDARPRLGKLANDLKQQIEARLDERLAATAAAGPPVGAVDVTLPGRQPAVGHRHPLTLLRERVEAIFSRMGFLIIEGPELEDDYHNFEALNMPPEHPARDMQDTLYLAAPVRSSAGTPATLLRTHTSGMQIRYMEQHQPPVRLIAPGRVYRRDNLDLTHTPMFTQVEGLVVGEDVSLADLKGTLFAFLRELFGEERKLRFRPSFFPYTEPSAEVDISCGSCGGTGFIPPKLAEVRASEGGPVPPKPGTNQPGEGGPVTPKLAQARASEGGPVTSKLAEVRASEGGPVTSKPGTNQPGEGGPVTSKLAEVRASEGGPVTPKLAQVRASEGGPVTPKLAEVRASEGGPVPPKPGTNQPGEGGCSMCKRTGWVEILGSGMVHPAVFEAVGYDPERYTGFAFGMGIERVALLKWGVEDIRLFYENDLRFLEQFPL